MKNILKFQLKDLLIGLSIYALILLILTFTFISITLSHDNVNINGVSQ